ncbi:MAG: OmpA family protein [Nevskia sp.]|nr:OmpA family protein [Nevskia sp.]
MNNRLHLQLIRSGLALTLLAAAVPSHADDVAMRPYIGESFMYTFSDSKRTSDNGVGGMIGGGVPINRFLNLELDGAYSHFNSNNNAGSQPWQQYLAKVDSQFFFSRNPEFAPYFALGAGYDKEVLKTVGRNGAFTADTGLGAIHYFKLFDTDFGVRADARYRWDDVKSSKFPGTKVSGSFGEPVLSLGLVIPLGGGAEAVGPGGGEGHPPPPPPPTQPGLKANQRFDDVHFAFDKYNLTEYAKASLDGDVTTINKLSGSYPSLKVDISGHTDWIGTDAYNQALSERRANAVKEYLVRKGVDAGRIRTYAYGESQPVAPNTTAEGRALNRRAEIRTTDGK